MVENTYVLVTLLVIGTALNGLMNLPYALQLAHGWTSLAFFTNLISVIILTPVIIIMATHYGPIGGAVAWTLLNVGYVLIQVQIMHRRLLKGQQWIWYRRDVGAPLAAALIPVVIGRWLLPGELTGWATLLYIMAVWSIATVAAGVAVPGLRAHFSRMITTTLLRSDPAG